MTGRQELLRNKPLAEWWISITHDPRFESVMVMLRAELSEESKNWEQLQGGNATLTMLSSITDNVPGSAPPPSPGLDHRSLEQIVADSKNPNPK